ncbi:MAG: hypothetical protein ACTSRZ_17350 [Promethearchaeota archaeon]
MEWRYGNSWEKYPIEIGQLWHEIKTNSYISIGDIRNDLPSFLRNADMIYCDPPWSKGNANSFITKANLNSYIENFDEFYMEFFKKIKEINCSICYLEIGKQNVKIFYDELSKIYSCINCWRITYYKKNPCFLLRGGHSQCYYNYSEMDEKYIPEMAIKIENPRGVIDMCVGQGLTAVAAFKRGIPFYGMDINKRRLAVLIEKIVKLGGEFEKYNF